MSESKFYAGIGSRDTPEEVLQVMYSAAVDFAIKGWTLRSGGAEGADSAFEQGAVEAASVGPGFPEIFLPWPDFSDHAAGENVFRSPQPWTLDIAQEHHPAWERLTRGGRMLHCRNVHQILGYHRDSKRSSFVLCWTKDGQATGGTGQAIRLAQHFDIPVYNLHDSATFERVRRAAA